MASTAATFVTMVDPVSMGCVSVSHLTVDLTAPATMAVSDGVMLAHVTFSEGCPECDLSFISCLQVLLPPQPVRYGDVCVLA